MATNLSRLLFFLVFLLPGPGFGAAACTVPGTTAACGELVSGLPWPFIIHVKEEKPLRITYLGSQGSQQSNLRLKMYLEVSDHGNREEAAEDFSKVCRTADPDFGLSYGWDLVMIRKKRIYHLHADCTLAEQHFKSMVKTLEQIISQPDKHTPPSLLCRCGGGCRLSE